MSLGFWGQRWVESSLSLKNLDPSLLMWDMRRNLQPTPLPPRRCTIKFIYPEMRPDRKSWWLVVDGDKVDLCRTDPGYEVDLYVQLSAAHHDRGLDGRCEARTAKSKPVASR